MREHWFAVVTATHILRERPTRLVTLTCIVGADKAAYTQSLD
eukprot:SAG25_NODE_4215_length_862_cov_1.660550_1_plen_41_part_01